MTVALPFASAASCLADAFLPAVALRRGLTVPVPPANIASINTFLRDTPALACARPVGARGSPPIPRSDGSNIDARIPAILYFVFEVSVCCIYLQIDFSGHLK